MYDLLPEPTDDENDMLDQASELRPTSRLGCQIAMSRDTDGIVVRLPKSTRNMQASDFEEGKRVRESEMGKVVDREVGEGATGREEVLRA